MVLLNLSVTDSDGNETHLCSTEMSPYPEEWSPTVIRSKVSSLVVELIEKLKVPA
jgi:hypothetical protein